MWPVTPNFLNALSGSHEIVTAAAAYLNGALVPGADDLRVVDGSVRVDGGSQVRRQLSAKIAAPDGNTEALRALLSVNGTELFVARGVAYMTGAVEFAPCGRFRLDQVDDDLSEAGAVSVTAPDLSARLVDDRFYAPRAGNAGITIGEQIRRLIQETIPTAKVFDYSGSTVTVRTGVVWERDRWQAVTDLADSVGCDVFADQVGDFVIAPRRTLDDPAVWTVSSNVRGVLLGAQRSTTRSSVYNSVVVSSQPTDGSTPIYAIAEDTDPTSPTYVHGPFGRVPRFYSSPLITTTKQAQTTANALLWQSVGARGTLSITTMVNPALDVGDRIDVLLPNLTAQAHIVDSFELPLTADASQSINTRTVAEIEDS